MPENGSPPRCFDCAGCAEALLEEVVGWGCLGGACGGIVMWEEVGRLRSRPVCICYPA